MRPKKARPLQTTGCSLSQSPKQGDRKSISKMGGTNPSNFGVTTTHQSTFGVKTHKLSSFDIKTTNLSIHGVKMTNSSTFGVKTTNSPASGRAKSSGGEAVPDYSKVDILGSWYTAFNFGANTGACRRPRGGGNKPLAGPQPPRRYQTRRGAALRRACPLTIPRRACPTTFPRRVGPWSHWRPRH